MKALVTGASSGIGLMYARELARQGHDLVLVSNQAVELLQVAEDLHYDEVYAYTWEIESDSYSSGYRERYKGLNVRAVEDNTAKPMIYFSDGKLSFPGTKIGTTASKNITISNIGKATLNISKVSTSKYFALSWKSATIEPGQSKTLTVSYTPVYNPDLVIDNDLTWDSTTLNITCDARNDNFNIYLEGYGVE